MAASILEHPMRYVGRLFAAALLATTLGSQAGADDGLVGERPNAGGPPDEILVRVAFLDIDGIDDREQKYNVDAFYEISWLDPRLANDHLDTGGSTRTFGVAEIWTPGLTIVNNRGL